MVIKPQNRYFFILDLLFCAAIPMMALTLRLNFSPRQEYLPAVLIFTTVGLLIKLPVFYVMGLYRRFWPYASVDTMVSISMAVFIAVLLTTGISFVLQAYVLPIRPLLPRSIPFIDGMLTIAAVGGSRLVIRASESLWSDFRRAPGTRRVLIAGAGDAGHLVAREIATSKQVSIQLFGFVDDHLEKIGKMIHGVGVLGTLEEIPALARRYDVNEVIITMPDATGKIIRKVVNACEEAGITSKILPGVYELLSITPSIDRLREVEIVDLLRREPVDVDLNVIVNLLANKRVLVTGAGGSIGSELCLQIANCGPARLVILGHGENSLYGLKNYLEKIGFRPPNLDFILADIRHPDRIESIYTRFEPEIIFHAAAHKHIPLMEENIEEAVTNNILGTWNLLQASKNHHVEKFIFISSSKAVKPISVMGMSKRAAEMLVQATAAETNLAYICIRLGNVLGTHGSVVPLFQRQIETGGPVTVTHPEMVRYFLTVREAVNLVLQSSVMGRNGEIFVLDLGDPIRIVDLARDMIELAGYRAGKDIEIVYTGLRPGERLDEHLYADDEIHSPSDHEKIFLAQNGSSLAFVDFQHEMDALQQLANAGETEKLRKRLIQLTGSPALKS